jgi:predicted porin
MKKTLITAAVAAGLLAAGAAQADDPTVYGIAHISVQKYFDNHCAGAAGGVCTGVIKSDEFNMTSQTSAIGVKGSEDLGDGLKALYKMEFEVTLDESTALKNRDQWVGLKGGFGTVKFGTMSSNYKETGGEIDPLYRTEAEGRGILNMQSNYLHGGQGNDRGRENNTLQYRSPKMGGVELVVNTTLSQAGGGNSSNDETLGLGLRYETKNIYAFFDYITPGYQTDSATQSKESAYKIGGKYSADKFSVALQYEAVEDLCSKQYGSLDGLGIGTGDSTGKCGDYIFAAGTYSIDGNNVVALTLGQQDKVSSAYALAYVHMLSKMTNVYVGYASVSEDSTGSYTTGVDETGNPNDKGSVITAGLRKKF